MYKKIICAALFVILANMSMFSDSIPPFLNMTKFHNFLEENKISENEISVIERNYTASSNNRYSVLSDTVSESDSLILNEIFRKLNYKVKFKDRIFYKLDMAGINPYLIILITAMLPIIELRGAIPVGILFFDLNPFLVIAVSIIGNIIPVFFILFLLKEVEMVLRKVKIFSIIIDKVFSITMAKSESIEKYEELGLMFFVGIPLPVTGAWTGSLLSYLLKLSYKKSTIYITAGVFLSAFIVSIMTFLGLKGLLTGISVLTLITVIKGVQNRINKK